MRPAVDICETRGNNIGVFHVSWVEGKQLGCIRVLDVAEVGKAEGVDEVTTSGLVSSDRHSNGHMSTPGRL